MPKGPKPTSTVVDTSTKITLVKILELALIADETEKVKWKRCSCGLTGSHSRVEHINRVVSMEDSKWSAKRESASVTREIRFKGVGQITKTTRNVHSRRSDTWWGKAHKRRTVLKAMRKVGQSGRVYDETLQAH